MPKPRAGEKQKDFIARCVPMVVKEGKTQKEASGQCYGVWKEHLSKKDLTLREQEDQIREAWNLSYGKEEPWPWLSYVFNDYAVTKIAGRYIKVPYTVKKGVVKFEDPKKWSLVEHSFKGLDLAKPEEAYRLVQCPIKAIKQDDGTYKYKAYAVLFGDAENTDLMGNYFTKDTDYHLDWWSSRPWLYHHARNPQVGTMKVGDWNEWGMDDQGVFFLGEMDKAFAYQESVNALLEHKKLFPSSGTLSYVAKAAEDGWLFDWPIAELSSTVSPAEYRMGSIEPVVIEAVKALRQGGLEMAEQQKGGLFGALGSLFSKTDPTKADDTEHVEVPPEGTAPADAEAAPDNSAPPAEETEVEPTLSIDEVREALGVPQVVEAITALDSHIKSISERLGVVEQVTQGLAKDEVERTKSAMAGDGWFKSLYVHSKAGEPVPADSQDPDVESAQQVSGSADESPFSTIAQSQAQRS